MMSIKKDGQWRKKCIYRCVELKNGPALNSIGEVKSLLEIKTPVFFLDPVFRSIQQWFPDI